MTRDLLHPSKIYSKTTCKQDNIVPHHWSGCAGHLQSLDLAVFGRLNPGHGIHSRKHLIGHRVINTVVAVLDVLLCQGPRGGHLVAVGAFCSTLALALHEERADGRAVALVVRCRALHLQDFVVCLRLPTEVTKNCECAAN